MSDQKECSFCKGTGKSRCLLFREIPCKHCLEEEQVVENSDSLLLKMLVLDACPGL